MATTMIRKKTEVRQQQIIEAAQRLIFKHGSEHLTVKRIAKEVGISEAAIYRHFKSKRSILLFLVSHIETILLTEISREGAGNEIVTLETIEKTIQKHFTAIDTRKGLAFLVIAEIISLGDKGLNKKASMMINTYISKLIELLAAGVKSGSVRQDIDLEASALLLFSMIQTIISIWSLNKGSFNLFDKFGSLWRVYSQAIAQR
ncbi:MAG TPA: TetR/AcrR family transcriptional regulator [Deltaproteobacteria bacterium]|nr:TetR/AcrR family transcriptional regulator [Deltaproteobacteria bacterium]HPR53801.1 TetR/AcrR family transcriptional regulator [Deltaproteobacteria bacterium]HXK45999.1 TetR/AcrR family transcriptional regulator [Deltaproteobacteria bacterium]